MVRVVNKGDLFIHKVNSSYFVLYEPERDQCITSVKFATVARGEVLLYIASWRVIPDGCTEVLFLTQTAKLVTLIITCTNRLTVADLKKHCIEQV